MAVTVASFAQVANWFTTTSPQTIGGLAWNTNDVIMVFGTGETVTLAVLATPTNANLTFGPRVSVTTGGSTECPAYFWSAVAGSSQSGQTISLANSAGGMFGFSVWVLSGASGSFANASANQTESGFTFTPTADSGVVYGYGDWAATSGKTIAAGTGTPTERVDTTNGTNYGIYSGDWVGVAASSATFGITSYAGMTVAHAVVEVLPSADVVIGAGTRSRRGLGHRGPGRRFDLLRKYHQQIRATETVAAAPDQPLVVAGISGAEAVGAATVTPGDVTIIATGIPGSEGVGSVTLTQTVTATGISSAEASGAVALGQGLVVAGITTAEQSGQAMATATATITASGIGTAERIGSAAIAQALAATGITSGEAAGQPALGQGLVASGIGSQERLGAAVTTPGTVTVTAAGIGSAEASGTAQVSLGAPQALTVTGISGAERLGAVAVTAAATIAPSGISSLEQSGAATVTPGPVALMAVGITTLAAMGQAAAGQGLLAAGITSAEKFGVVSIIGALPSAAKAGQIEPGTRAFAGIEPGLRAGAGTEPGTRGSAVVATGGRVGVQIEPGTKTGPNIEGGG